MIMMESSMNSPEIGPRAPSLLRTLWQIYVTHRGRSATAMRMVNVMTILKRHGRLGRRAALHFERRLQARYGCYISRDAEVAPDVQFPHPVGIVIGQGSTVGPGCTIYQHVTLGAQRLGEAALKLYPTIEADVTLFTGAVVIGAVTVCRGAKIGANSVVNRDIPPGVSAVGAPARIVRKADQAMAGPTSGQTD
jgi:serine O-acetyltransferase